jgi:preprotein translocase subunit SecG
MLEQLVIIFHVISAVAIVGLILLQQGKGADMGASFGSGASQTVLGVQGGGNLLTHTTAVLTAVFFVTSLSLAFYAKEKTMVDAEDILIEEMVQQADNNDEIPQVNTPVIATESTEVVDESGDVPAVIEAPKALVESTGSEEIPE